MNTFNETKQGTLPGKKQIDDELVASGENDSVCFNHRQESVPTPMTEVSASPESEQHADNNDDLSQYNEQRHLSQTDHHIHILDQNGSLNEIAGSQSMLSQEILDHKANFPGELSQQSEPYFGYLQSREDEKVQLESVEPHDDLSQQINQASEWLLTQSREEGTKIQAHSETHHDSTTHAGTHQFSGLELLTQVGSQEADKLAQSYSTPPSAAAASTETGSGSLNVSNRDNEGFGTLLNAVAKITEQEALESKRMPGMPMVWELSSQINTSLPESTESNNTTRRSARKITKSKKTVTSLSSKHAFSKKRKTDAQKNKEKLRREKSDNENKKAQGIARKAAMIAERTISDPVIAKKLLLSMALQRRNPRSTPQNIPGKEHVIQEGFFWAHYPPLESVLKKNMAEYYELSTQRCQSAQQQAFNNYMVLIVRGVAEKQKWKFAECFEQEKNLRDRIRCYYKTHIQNSKKRLRTMLQNPTKQANARHLCDHLDLIETLTSVEDSSQSNDKQNVTNTMKHKIDIKSDRAKTWIMPK